MINQTMYIKDTMELQPTNQKSYYGKAIIIEYTQNVFALKSYNTIVACYNENTQEMEVFGTYSATTLKHIKDFIKFFDLPCGTKKFIEETYIKGDN